MRRVVAQNRVTTLVSTYVELDIGVTVNISLIQGPLRMDIEVPCSLVQSPI